MPGEDRPLSMKGRTVVGGTVRLVPLAPAHTELVVRWRNGAAARRAFLSDAPITAASHEAWLARKSTDDRDLTYVIETADGRPAGMVALYDIDRPKGAAEFGRLLIGEEDLRGRGLALAAVRTLIDGVAAPLGLTVLVLDVFADNDRAVSLYRTLGFRTESERPHPSGRTILHMRRVS